MAHREKHTKFQMWLSMPEHEKLEKLQICTEAENKSDAIRSVLNLVDEILLCPELEDDIISLFRHKIAMARKRIERMKQQEKTAVQRE